MDPMGGVRQAMNSQTTVLVPTPGAACTPALFPAALPGGGAQLAAAFFPPPTPFVGMPPPFLGTPATEFLLPGAYPRQLIGHLDVSGYPVDYPYGMAIAKGSSLDAEGGVAKKPRTVFTPKQLLHLEEQFVKTQFPNMEQRRKIAKDLDLTQQHIQIWFQNRRAKKRRKKKRHSEEEKLRCNPEPPSFWPSNLPFSSNIGDMAKTKSPKETSTTPAGEDLTTNSPASVNDRDSPHLPTPRQQHSPSTRVSSAEPLQTPPGTPSYTHSNGSNSSSSSSGTSSSSSETGSGTNSSRPTHLQCNTYDGPLKSPTLAVTPGKGHSQLPTPPHPQLPPVTSLMPATGNYMQSPMGSMMSDSPGSAALMTPPGELHVGLLRYPPTLPPPESLLAGGSYHANIDEAYPSTISMCDSSSLHSFHSLSAQSRNSSSSTPRLAPPPYSFSGRPSSNSSSSQYPQLPYSTVAQSANNMYIESISLSTVTMSLHLKSLHPLSSSVPLTTGPTPSISPTQSPITNSDCSLAMASPLTEDVSLMAPTFTDNLPSVSSTNSHTDLLTLEDEGSSLIPNLDIVSSPIQAQEPVILTDLLGSEWDLFSNSLRSVVQTDQDMWMTDSAEMLGGSIPGPGPASLALAATLTGSSKPSAPPPNSSKHEPLQQFSSSYSNSYFPPYSSEAASTQHYPVSSMSNGANI